MITYHGEQMRQTRILPFYMTYPMPLFYQEQDTVTRDLEYLQEMYPVEAKKYQKVIAGILDRLDYEGSIIYDEYPDKWQIYRLTQITIDKLKESGEEEPAADLVQVLLCYEIYKRRHITENGILKF